MLVGDLGGGFAPAVAHIEAGNCGDAIGGPAQGMPGFLEA